MSSKDHPQFGVPEVYSALVWKMDIVRSKDVVTAFLSCSVRPNDWPLVDALEEKVLRPLGFRCFTIGRNVSLPDQPDDAVRRL